MAEVDTVLLTFPVLSFRNTENVTAWEVAPFVIAVFFNSIVNVPCIAVAVPEGASWDIRYWYITLFLVSVKKRFLTSGVFSPRSPSPSL